MTGIAITGFGIIEEGDHGKSVDLSELPKPMRTFLREEELVLYACYQAISDASIPVENGPLSIGIVLGVDEGIDNYKSRFYDELISDGPDSVSPILFPFTSPNAITAQVSIAFGIKGENITLAEGALSSAKAIHYAVDLLSLGKVTTVITGGVTGDCAAMLILEHSEIALRRGAEVYGEIVGYGEDTLGHPISAITEAFDDAEIPLDERNFLMDPDEIEKMSAHGAASSARAVVQTLKKLKGNVRTVTVQVAEGGSCSLVIKPRPPSILQGGIGSGRRPFSQWKRAWNKR